MSRLALTPTPWISCILMLVTLAPPAEAGACPAQLAVDGTSVAQAGRDVAIDGSTVVVGAADANDTRGVAYVFRRDTTWTLEEILESPSSGVGDHFGTEVAVDGDWIAVGSHGSGTVHMFRRSSGSWRWSQFLGAPDGGSASRFGRSVDLSGDRLVVGAPRASARRGSAYVYRLDGTWELEDTLWAPVRRTGAELGISVAIDGSRVLAGAYKETRSLTQEGVAYLFERSPTGDWAFRSELLPLDPTYRKGFGGEVTIEGSTAAVAAMGDDEAAENSGAVYLFRETSGAWAQQVKLVTPDGDEEDQFGHGVDLDEGRLLVGSAHDDVAAPGAGALFLYEKGAAGDWNLLETYRLADAQPHQMLGFSVALDSPHAVAGALWDHAGGYRSGAAYVFCAERIVPPEVILEGPEEACPGETIVLDGRDSKDQDELDGGREPRWEWDLDLDADTDGDGDPGNDLDATSPVVETQADSCRSLRVRLTYFDDDGQSASEEHTVGVVDGTPPILRSLGPLEACYPTEAEAETSALARAEAFDDCPAPLRREATTRGDCHAQVIVTVTDACDNASSLARATRIDGEPPRILDLGPWHEACLWEPNHRWTCLEELTHDVGAVDNCGGIEVHLEACSSDQPGDGLGDGHTAPDCLLTGPVGARTGLCVRGERQGMDPTGRDYRTRVIAADACSNTAEGSHRLHVPRDRRSAARCVP